MIRTGMARGAAALLTLLLLVLSAPHAWAADPPLVVAATSGDTATLATLLQQGVDPNTADDNKLTALNWAAYNGHLDAVRALVQRGARIDAHDSKSGWTPLMNASAMNFPDVVAYLV